MSDVTMSSSAPAANPQATSAETALRIARRIADEIACQPAQVNAVVTMLDEGSTVPFIARYRKEGYDTIPERGQLAALTVAGAVSSWKVASEAAAALGGRMPRGDLLAAAIRHAREGVPVSGCQWRRGMSAGEKLKDVPGFAAHFLHDGKVPEIGAPMVQPRLADTLEHIARSGYDDFYRGDVSAEIATDLEEVGSPVTREDLRKHEARLVTPLSVRLNDCTVFNMPPPTQGIASLIILGLFDRLGVKRGESFEHIHGLIEAAKIAGAVRDAEVTDPRFANNLKPYLEPEWLDAEVARIDMKRAGRANAGADGDTIHMSVVDGNGLAVSFIQSIYWEWGSGVVLPRTGILWQNRGISFSLDPASVNPLEPGRKPFHTLNPAFARFDDGRVMPYGSMGGDGQPQFQAAIFTRHARFGMEPGDAVDAPRWRLGRTWGSDGAELTLEDGFDPDLVTALEKAGHGISILPERYSDSLGHADMIIRRPDGRFIGAADPRSDGAAVAV